MATHYHGSVLPTMCFNPACAPGNRRAKLTATPIDYERVKSIRNYVNDIRVGNAQTKHVSMRDVEFLLDTIERLL